jgi:flagellar FliL protein
MRQFWIIAMVLIALFSQQILAQDDAEAEGGEPAKDATIYFDLKPPFVVNYGGVGKLRYLKTEITLRVAGGDLGMKGIRHHLPYIRHALVMTLTKQSDEDISSVEGRELLRLALLEEVRRVLVEEEGEEYVRDLLFNSFIVQR